MLKFSKANMSVLCVATLSSTFAQAQAQTQTQTEAQTETVDRQPSTQFVELSYANYTNHGDIQVDNGGFRGFTLNASIDIADNWYIPLYYERVAEDYSRQDFIFEDSVRREYESTFDSKLDQYSVGIGYRLGISEQAIMTFDFNFIRENTDVSFGANTTSAAIAELLRDRNIPVDGDLRTKRTNNKHRLGVSYQHKFNEQWQANIRADFTTEDLSDGSDYESSVSGEVLYYFNQDWAIVGRIETGNVKRQSIGVRYDF